MFWDIGVLETFYSILQQPQSQTRLTNGVLILDKCVDDLNNLLVTPTKSQESRTKVETLKFSVHDIEYEVSKEFVYAVIQLADELNIDELVLAEFLLNISERKKAINEFLLTQDSLVKEGRVAFFLRRQYLLQILNYVFNLNTVKYDKLVNIIMEKLDLTLITENIFKSLENLHSNFNLIIENINKDNTVQQYTSLKKDINKLKRDFLTREYDIIAQFNTGFLLNNNKNIFYDDQDFKKIFSLLDFSEKNMNNNDSFILYYLPLLLQFGNFLPKKINKGKENYIWNLLNKITKDIETNEKLYLCPFRVLIYLNILVNITEWFKEDPTRITYNQQTLDFENKISKPIYKLVLLGAIEELMIFASMTTKNQEHDLTDQVGSVRLLLEKHLPKLLPFSLQDTKLPSIEMTGYILESKDTVKSIELSVELKDYFIVNSLNSLIVKFIEHCPFILNQLREEEEEALLKSIQQKQIEDQRKNNSTNKANGKISNLSNNGFFTFNADSNNLNKNEDSLYKKADIERFFISCYYVYNNREELGMPFWEDKESALNGFIKWGSKCKDSLMTSCYYIMLSSFANNKNLSKTIFSFVMKGKQFNATNFSSITVNKINKESNYFDNLASIIDEFSQAIQEWENGKKDSNNGFGNSEIAEIDSDIFNRHTNLGRHNIGGLNSSKQGLPQHLGYMGRNSRFSQYDSSKNNDSEAEKNISFENLNEESVLLLSSLISFVGNISSNLEDSEKETIANIFTNILFQLMNLNTPLLGLIMKTVGSFITKNNRNDIWIKLDSLIFGNTLKNSSKHILKRDDNKFILNPQSSSYIHFFKNNFQHITEIFGFVELFKKLTTLDKDTEVLSFDQMILPVSFGSVERIQKGISPYLEYVINDLFVNSQFISDVYLKSKLQVLILETINNCFKTFDYQKLIDLNSCLGINMDLLVPQRNFVKYLIENPAIYVISNFLNIGENIEVLLNLIKVNQNQKILTDTIEVEKLELATDVLKYLCLIDDCFNDAVLPSIKEGLRSTKYYYVDKSIFEFKNTKTFKDILRRDVDLVTKLFLNLSTPYMAMNISNIDTISLMFESNDDHQMNQLFNILQNSEDSISIKNSFMLALDTPLESKEGFEYKIKLIKFLNERVSSKSKVVQLISGFQLDPSTTLGPSTYQTFISSNVSVFGSLIKLIIQCLEFVNEQNVPLIPMRLLSACFELLKNMTALDLNLLAGYLLNIGFIEELIRLTFVVDKKTTLWNGVENKFDLIKDTNNPSFITIMTFFKFRSELLELLSLVIHEFKNSQTIGQVINSLIGSTSGDKPIIFKLLDILNNDFLLFNNQSNISYDNFSKMYLSQLELYNTGVNFEYVLNTLSLKEYTETGEDIFDFKKLDSLLDLKYSWLQKASKLATANDEQDEKERFILKNSITELNTRAIFNKYQQSVVHNWNVLVQLIVTDGVLSIEVKNKFILNTFESLIGEVELLIDSNIKYAEEFISLIVMLYDILSDLSYNVYDKNLYKLFMASVQGISSPLTSVSMRSDLYVLMNKYLTSLIVANEKTNEVNGNASVEVVIHPTLKRLIHDLKMLDEKLIEIMVLDCINGSCQSPERITSVLFLKSLVHLGNFVSGNKSNFIIKALSNSNMLSNLISSIKNLDEMVHNDTYAALSFDDVKYELTVFKFTMSVLTDIASTRLGAYELLQNDAMSVVNKLRFESLDLNLGTDLEFKEFITLNQTLTGQIRIKLDNNVPSMGNNAKSKNEDLISVFEILIPIFKFVVTISGSLSFENKQLKLSISKFLKKHDQQIKNLLKRDSLMVENNSDKSVDNATYSADLQTLIKLIILLFNEMRE